MKSNITKSRLKRPLLNWKIKNYNKKISYYISKFKNFLMNCFNVSKSKKILNFSFNVSKRRTGNFNASKRGAGSFNSSKRGAGSFNPSKREAGREHKESKLNYLRPHQPNLFIKNKILLIIYCKKFNSKLMRIIMIKEMNFKYLRKFLQNISNFFI